MGIDGLVAARALVWREVLRTLRQPTRMAGLLGTALFMWVLLGSGFASSFQMPGAGSGAEQASYASYVFPGIVTVVVVFGTVFTSISLIQDRQAGFLQAVLVSPTPRWAVVGSKVGSGVLTALVEGALLLLVGMLSGVVETGFFGVVGVMMLIGLTAAAIISMGLVLAWWVDSVAGLHGIMNLVLMPMWLLSGALFPAEGAHGWLGVLMRLNPLGWATRAMGDALGVVEASPLDWFGTVLFAAVFVGLAVWVVNGGGTKQRK